MKHVVFARFGDRSSADAAVAGLRQDAGRFRRLRLVYHQHAQGEHLAEQVQHSESGDETDGRHGRVVGLTTGGVAGAAIGSILFPVLFGFDTGVVLTGVGFGILTGVLVGVLMSGVFGSGLTDHRLRALARELSEDEVLVTITAPNQAEKDRVEREVREHGGCFLEKSLV